MLILIGPGKPYWVVFFEFIENYFFLWKHPKKKLKPSTEEKKKTKMKQYGIRTRTQPPKPTVLTIEPLTNGKMGDS